MGPIKHGFGDSTEAKLETLRKANKLLQDVNQEYRDANTRCEEEMEKMMYKWQIPTLKKSTVEKLNNWAVTILTGMLVTLLVIGFFKLIIILAFA